MGFYIYINYIYIYIHVLFMYLYLGMCIYCVYIYISYTDYLCCTSYTSITLQTVILHSGMLVLQEKPAGLKPVCFQASDFPHVE